MALEAHHFVVPLPRPHLALQPFAWDFGNSSDAIGRMTEGVAALMLSLRRRFLIRCGGKRLAAGRGGRMLACLWAWTWAWLPAVCLHASAGVWCRGVPIGRLVMVLAAGGQPHAFAAPAAAHMHPPCPVLRSYQRGSEICERFAASLHHLTAVEERELFDFGSRGGSEGAPVLLVLDRRDDPVTPLLSQWTYQVRAARCTG